MTLPSASEFGSCLDRAERGGRGGKVRLRFRRTEREIRRRLNVIITLTVAARIRDSLRVRFRVAKVLIKHRKFMCAGYYIITSGEARRLFPDLPTQLL